MPESRATRNYYLRIGSDKWDEQVLRIGETVTHEKAIAAPHRGSPMQTGYTPSGSRGPSYVDDHLYATRTPADRHLGPGGCTLTCSFLLLKAAVSGNWLANPDASSPFPQTMLVDLCARLSP
jgi:hypothetical protein